MITDSIQYTELGYYDITHTGTIQEICEEEYPFLINDLLKFIQVRKRPEYSIVDVILQYSLSKGIDVRLIGDAILDDEYLKEYIQKELQQKESDSW